MGKWKALYLKLFKKYEIELGQEYFSEIKKAGDKEFVHNEFNQKLENRLNKDLHNDNTPYRRQIDTIIKEILVIQKRDISLDFDGAFNQIVKDYTEEEKKIILNKISKIEGYKMFYSQLPYVLEEITENMSLEVILNNCQRGFPTVENDDTIIIPINSEIEQINSPQIETKDENNSNPINWTNLSQRDFIKLIYAIHYAGYIENGKGKVTQIVQEIAKRLNFDLGENWQPNFSKGLKYENNEFKSAKIFEELKSAFLEYQKKLKEK